MGTAGPFRVQSGRGVKLTPYLNLVPSLRKTGHIPSLPHAVMTRREEGHIEINLLIVITCCAENAEDKEVSV